MKKSILLTTLLLTFILCNAQSGNWVWGRQGHGTANNIQEGTAVATDNHGNVYVAGTYNIASMSIGTNTYPLIGTTDLVMAKYNANGNFLWSIAAGGNGGSHQSFATGVATDARGNVYLTGGFNSSTITFGPFTLTNPSLSGETFLVKFDSLGTILWARQSNGSNSYGEANAVATDAVGNVLITGDFGPTITFGSTTLTSNVGSNLFVTKYDSSGTVLWAKTITGTGQSLGIGIITDTSGNVYISGTFNSSTIVFGSDTLLSIGYYPSNGNDNFCILKYSSTGTELWARQSLGFTNSTDGSKIAIDCAGNIYASGTNEDAIMVFGNDTLMNYSGSHVEPDAFIVKYSQQGVEQWAKRVGGPGNQWGYAVATDASGVYLSAGEANHDSTVYFGTDSFILPYGTFDYAFLIKYDFSGNVIDHSVLASGGDDICAVATDHLGNLYMGGDVEGNYPVIFGSDTLTGEGSERVFVAKYHSYTPQDSFTISTTTTCSSAMVHVLDTARASNPIFNYIWYDSLNNIVRQKTASTDTLDTLRNVPVGRYTIEVQLIISCSIKSVRSNVRISGGGTTFSLGNDTTICTGQSIILRPTGTSGSNLWSDGSRGSSLLVSTTGTYWVQVTQNGCTAADTIVVTVNPCTVVCASVAVTHDTTVCPNTNLQLNATVTGGTNIVYAWSPHYGLSDSTIANPVATVTNDTTYILRVTSLSTTNGIVNGDFSAGNTGFSSSYTYTNVQPAGCGPWGILGCPNYYNINTNPHNTHSNFASFGDHTTGTGQMFIANGASTAIDVWCQTITVLPNTNYQFSAWATDVVTSFNSNDWAILQFSINGGLIGSPITLQATAGNWSNFFANWNSGSNTSVTICIKDLNTNGGGNDFALDDISFKPVCSVFQSVRLTTFKNPTVNLGRDTALCDSFHYTLSPISVTGTGTLTYTWKDNTHNLLDTVSQPGTYWLQVANQCTSRADTVVIAQRHSPTVNLGRDSTICNQAAYGMIPVVTGTTPLTYLWQDNSTNTFYNATTNGSYSTTVTNICGTARDTINLTFVSSPTAFNLGNDTTICSGTSITLSPNPVPTGTFTWQDSSHGATLSVSNPKEYYLWVRNGCGATVDSIHIDTLIAPIAFSLGRDTLVCGSGPVLITPTPTPANTGIFTWQDSSSTATYSATTTGNYWLRVQNKCGSAADSMKATFTIPPTVNIGRDTFICDVASYTIVPTVTGTNPSYLWQDASTGNTFTATASGLDSLIVSNACGTASSKIQVTFSTSPPAINLGNDTAYCTPFNRTLTVVSPTTHWSTGVIGTQIIVTNPNTYWAKDSNTCGVKFDTIMLSEPIFSVNLGKDTTLCSGETITLKASTANATYRWSDQSTNDTLVVSNPATYRVTVTVSGCALSDSIQVKYIATSPPSLGNDTTLCNGDKLILIPSYGNNPVWQDGSQTPSYTVSAAGAYSVTVQTICGIRSGSVNIQYESCSCELAIPTGFTPNGDGVNDVFRAVYKCAIGAFNLQVFDRWGQKVFESNDPKHGWDGTFKETPQPLDVYIWQISYFDALAGKTKFLAGNVSLIR